MGSPWNIDKGADVVVIFNNKAAGETVRATVQVGPDQQHRAWDAVMVGTFQQWITEPGLSQRTGLVIRSKWGDAQGQCEIDWMIELHDVLMLGVKSKILTTKHIADMPRGVQ
jgi:hypothetical protein